MVKVSVVMTEVANSADWVLRAHSVIAIIDGSPYTIKSRRPNESVVSELPCLPDTLVGVYTKPNGELELKELRLRHKTFITNLPEGNGFQNSAKV